MVRLARVPRGTRRFFWPIIGIGIFLERPVFKRGDIVLVDHPEHGKLVRRVHVVGREGSIALEPIAPPKKRLHLGPIEPDRVLGKLAFRVL